jgi:hypothetical protein
MEKRELGIKIEEIFDRYQKKVEGEISVCDLGSCQYETIQHTAEFVKELLDLLGPERVEELLEIKYSKKITDIAEFEKDLTQFCEDMEWSDFHGEGNYPSFRALLETEFPEYLDDYSDGRISLAAYLEITREQAWDLWSAMPSIFSDLEIGFNMDLPTYGPILNQRAQSENFRLGVDLGYMMYYFTFLAKLEFFSGFDT